MTVVHAPPVGVATRLASSERQQMDEATKTFLGLIGGIGLLLYGMNIAGEGLQQAAGTRLRHMLSTLTRNRIYGAALGAVATALMQSSSATSVLLVGLVGAGLLSLGRTLGILLGADIGATISVQLISFDIFEWAPLLVAVGVALILVSKGKAYSFAGRAILGFGLVFFGMGLMTEASGSWANNELFRDLIGNLSASPLILFVLGLVVTAIIQSSAGTIGIAIALAANQLIDLESALPIILGANIGTSATALIASAGGPLEARRVAVAHALFKIAGVALVFPAMGPFADLIQLAGGSAIRQIANAHTLFNVALAVVFLPLTGQFAWVIRKLLPDRAAESAAAGARFLDPVTLSSPPLAIGQATREILRMADLVQEMLRDWLVVLAENDGHLAEQISERDDDVDRLQSDVRSFLTRISETRLSGEMSEKQIGLLYVTHDLENIGDVIDKNLLELALKKIHGRHMFSEKGWSEIQEYHERVERALETAISAFATGDVELANNVIREKEELSDREREMRRAHIARLNTGRAESLDSSDIHLDVLTNLKRVNTYSTNLAYVVKGEL